MNNFSFGIYRINFVDFESLFDNPDTQRLRTNEDFIKILRNACKVQFDLDQETPRSLYKWSLRDAQSYIISDKSREFVSVVLSRSTIEQEGEIVTDEHIAHGLSSSQPPLATSLTIFLDLTRHIAAIERNSKLNETKWQMYLQEIIKNSALELGFSTDVEFEPIPAKNKVLDLFKSFDLITKLKVTLLIPNPELTRYTKTLYEDLVQSNIREYTQEMVNPNGISRNENQRPYASTVLAQQGYSRGPVEITGYRDDNFESVKSDSISAIGRIKQVKQFIKGMYANAKSKETKKVLEELAKEIDRLHPKAASTIPKE